MRPCGTRIAELGPHMQNNASVHGIVFSSCTKLKYCLCQSGSAFRFCGIKCQSRENQDALGGLYLGALQVSLLL